MNDFHDWITHIMGALAVFAAFFFPIRSIIKESKASNKKKGTKRNVTTLKSGKKNIAWVYILITFIILVTDLICHLVSPTEQLVFVGGGSVRNFLQEEYNLNIRQQRNSINLGIASGSAWRVLGEEYQLDQGKERKESIKEKDDQNKYIAICLSGSKMSRNFYSEYISNFENAIVVEVFLGYDKLVTYISKALSDYWKLGDASTIQSDTLAQKMQELMASNYEIVENDKVKKVAVFSTNKTSGTLELYKNSLQKYIDLEKMIDNKKTIIFYDNMDPEKVYLYKDENGQHNREFVIFGSQYYNVEGLSNVLCVEKKLLDCDGKYIKKPMFLYFLANKQNNDHYKISESVFGFLLNIESKLKELNKTIPDTTWNTIKKDKGMIKCPKKGNEDEIIIKTIRFAKEE